MHRMVDQLLTLLVACGSKAFDVFCNILEQVNSELADELRSQARRSSPTGKRININRRPLIPLTEILRNNK